MMVGAVEQGHLAQGELKQAPFSYLTLYCLIINGPKRGTHHIFYLVQKIAIVQRKKGKERQSYPDPTALHFQCKIFD